VIVLVCVLKCRDENYVSHIHYTHMSISDWFDVRIHTATFASLRKCARECYTYTLFEALDSNHFHPTSRWVLTNSMQLVASNSGFSKSIKYHRFSEIRCSYPTAAFPAISSRHSFTFYPKKSTTCLRVFYHSQLAYLYYIRFFLSHQTKRGNVIKFDLDTLTSCPFSHKEILQWTR